MKRTEYMLMQEVTVRKFATVELRLGLVEI